MTKDEFNKLYKKTEGRLFNYRKILDDLEMIDLEIAQTENEYIGCMGISYDSEKTGITYNVSKSVEQEVIRKEERINYLKYTKIKLEIEKRKIEISINNFTIQQKELFEILYFSKRARVSRNEILRKMHISKSTYYELKNSLVISALNSLYPTILRDEIYKKFA